MWEQDYFMRMLLQAIRALMDWIFKSQNDADLIRDPASAEKYRRWIALADQGKINQAENLLFESLDPECLSDLGAALCFYEHIAQFPAETLYRADFSYSEIRDGVTDVLTQFGYHDMAELFFG